MKNLHDDFCKMVEITDFSKLFGNPRPKVNAKIVHEEDITSEMTEEFNRTMENLSKSSKSLESLYDLLSDEFKIE